MACSSFSPGFSIGGGSPLIDARRSREAIKIARERLGLGLKEAKELVDRVEAADPILARNAQQRSDANGRSCLTFLVAVAILAAAAWYFLA